MDRVTLTVDGRTISANPGQSVLNAALDAGIYIPHLCSHPDLPPQANCKLCVVEVAGQDGVVCSCELPASEGLQVVTQSSALLQRRKVALELMLAGHPKDCVSCKRYMNCELQAMIQYLGTVHSRMRVTSRKTDHLNVDNPLVVREMERCIQCGRCVRACDDLRGVGILGFNRRGDEVYVGTAGDLPLGEAGCRFCSACVAVCPTGALQDQFGIFRDDLPWEEAIVPCGAECPAHADIPAYLRLIQQGRHSEAIAVIREKVPFPHVLGYVCNHRCESGCKRTALNSPVSIRNLKRYAAERDTEQVWRGKGFHKDRTGKRIAVIGGGPAGLTAAYYLNKLGHDVTVYEKQNVAGGYMALGIPEFRAPTAVVQAEVGYIVESGVRVLYGQTVESAAALKAEHDAVLVAVGTPVGKKLRLPGANYRQVYTAVDFLRASRLGQTLDLGKTCCVIGGGNVAFDVAGTLLRMGVRATVVCLEKGEAMLADRDEIEAACSEGAVLYDGHSNEGIEGTPEQVTGLRVHEVSEFHFDRATGALVETAIPDSTRVIACDSIVFAAGQATGLTEGFGLELNRFGYPVDPQSGKSGHRTNLDGVFCAGDVITGTSFVINAIESGRQAASLIDRYLGGDGQIDETLVERVRQPKIGKVDGFYLTARQELSLRPASERVGDFKPINVNFNADQAACEASRCLQCDLRKDIHRSRIWSEYAVK